MDPEQRQRVEAALTALSTTLWRERGMIEDLVYRLEVQQWLLSSGKSRWLPRAAAEVEALIQAIGEEELLRATQVASVAELVELSADASMSELCEASPGPWCEILRDHQAAFLALVSLAEGLSQENKELLHRALRSTREEMDLLGRTEVATGYSRAGRVPAPTSSRPTLLDWEV